MGFRPAVGKLNCDLGYWCLGWKVWSAEDNAHPCRFKGGQVGHLGAWIFGIQGGAVLEIVKDTIAPCISYLVRDHIVDIEQV